MRAASSPGKIRSDALTGTIIRLAKLESAFVTAQKQPIGYVHAISHHITLAKAGFAERACGHSLRIGKELG
jgi:hypothetical protein